MTGYAVCVGGTQTAPAADMHLILSRVRPQNAATHEDVLHNLAATAGWHANLKVDLDGRAIGQQNPAVSRRNVVIVTTWWAMLDLNQRPPACEAGALPLS